MTVCIYFDCRAEGDFTEPAMRNFLRLLNTYTYVYVFYNFKLQLNLILHFRNTYIYFVYTLYLKYFIYLHNFIIINNLRIYLQKFLTKDLDRNMGLAVWTIFTSYYKYFLFKLTYYWFFCIQFSHYYTNNLKEKQAITFLLPYQGCHILGNRLYTLKIFNRFKKGTLNLYLQYHFSFQYIKSNLKFICYNFANSVSYICIWVY